MSIASQIHGLLKLPCRQCNVAIQYILSLLQDTGRHTLQAASQKSGLHAAQFSRFLSGHTDLALDNLNHLACQRLKQLVAQRHLLEKGAPWTIAIIIDATLHERSSRHLDNAQRFNHGQGWVIGHQWTNVLIVINGELVALPPIPFLTAKTCKKLGQAYKTEPERIIEYLSTLDWQDLLPGVDPSEMVVLSDSGYDNKVLQNFILSKGWDFIGSIKKTRSVYTSTQQRQSVEDLFSNTRKSGPWQTVYHKINGGKKRREIATRTLIGFLKGVSQPVKLMSVEKPNKQRLHLACSHTSVSTGAITRLYRMRWKIELFHRDVKSYLGLEDAGLTKFQSIHSHVLWVYCAYLLLPKIAKQGPHTEGTLSMRRQVEKKIWDQQFAQIQKLNGRFDAKTAVRNHCLQVREKLLAA